MHIYIFNMCDKTSQIATFVQYVQICKLIAVNTSQRHISVPDTQRKPTDSF